MKSLIKYMFCFVAYYSGLVFIYRKLFRSRAALILTYHRVISADEAAHCISQPGMIVSENSFRSQMQYISKAYRVVPLGDLVDGVRTKRDSGSKCAVTFDDGWRDVYANAYPILKKMNLKSTIFLATGLIGTMRLFWPERLTSALLSGSASSEQMLKQLSKVDVQCAELVRDVNAQSDRKARLRLIDRLIERLKLIETPDRETFVTTVDGSMEFGESSSSRHLLDWDEVDEMKTGGVSYGSHTENHVLLTSVSVDVAEREIRESKSHLENKLGEPAELFAYPNGNWNESVRNLVRDAGFKAAVIAANRRNDHETDSYLFGRLNVHEGMSLSPWKQFSRAMFACETSGFLSLFRKLPEQY